MSDYIKRKDALTVVEKVCDVCMALSGRPTCGECSVADAVRKVKHIPAADVVKIEPGSWILTDFDGNTMKIKGIQRGRIEVENETDVVEREVCHDTGESRVFRCSNCGYGVDDIFEDKDAPVYLFERFEYWHYCPNCGADVREIDDET